MKTRGEIIAFGEVVQLKVEFTDTNNLPADLDAIPAIQIVQPDASEYKAYGSAGVYRISTGIYGYDFTIPINGPVGIWVDNWQGILSGDSISGSFALVVFNIDIQHQSIYDGYEQLGDEPIYELTQEAIHNLNKLIKMLRLRLQSQGRSSTTDGYGNTVYQNCDIFSIEELYAFLVSALAEFNMTPHFSGYSYEDVMVVDSFADILVEGAYIMALMSKALIEKGREFTITDNGIGFNPPNIADFLQGQATSLLGPYREKLKLIKANFKPQPLGCGTLRIAQVAPQFLRLRHLRAHQLL